MKGDVLTQQGWLQTDGSCETLQYGRKVNDTTWEYMEWVDGNYPTEEPKTLEFKLANLDHKNWRKDTIDLNDYLREEVLDALSTFGYSFHSWYATTLFEIHQGGHTYSFKDSVQLACECIFELEL